MSLLSFIKGKESIGLRSMVPQNSGAVFPKKFGQEQLL